MSDSDLVRTRLAGQGSGGHHGYTSDTSHPLNNGYTSDTTYADSAAHYSDRWSLKRTFAKFKVSQSQNTEKAPTKAFSWLKVVTTAKTLC